MALSNIDLNETINHVALPVRDGTMVAVLDFFIQVLHWVVEDRVATWPGGKAHFVHSANKAEQVVQLSEDTDFGLMPGFLPGVHLGINCENAEEKAGELLAWAKSQGHLNAEAYSANPPLGNKWFFEDKEQFTFSFELISPVS
jgi:hypothetical protein